MSLGCCCAWTSGDLSTKTFNMESEQEAGKKADKNPCIPKDPCMVYLPTFTIKINQIQVNEPYMDPMGIDYASVRNVYLNFIWCKQKQTRIKGLVLIRVLSIYTKHRLPEACHQSTQSCFYTKNDSMTRFYANGNQHQQPVPQVEDKTWPVRLWNKGCSSFDS